jgi:hypothetical protein
LNAAKLVVPAAAASLPGDVSGAGAGGAVLERRRERRERVGARGRSGGGRGFIDGALPRRSEAEEADAAVRFGDTLGRGVERGGCTVGELPENLLVLGVSRETTYGPVGEAGISTLLRTQ